MEQPILNAKSQETLDKERVLWVRQLLKDNAPLIYQRLAPRKFQEEQQIKKLKEEFEVNPKPDSANDFNEWMKAEDLLNKNV